MIVDSLTSTGLGVCLRVFPTKSNPRKDISMKDENIFDQNKEIARRFYEECWNQGKIDRADQFISKDCRYHNPAFPSLAPGVDSMKRHITMSRNAFPDLRFSLDDMIAERDEVVVHWT